MSLNTKSKEYTVPKEPLLREFFPHYFDSCETSSCIDASDALGDLRTAEFVEPYFLINGITSVLDCPLYIGSSARGVISFQHTGPALTWSEMDKAFAVSIADIINLAIAHRDQMENAASLDSGLNITMQGVLVVNQDGEIIRSNKIAEEIFSYTKNELFESYIEQILPGVMDVDTGLVHNVLQQNEEIKNNDFSARKKYGQLFPVEISISIITNRRIPHALICIEDVSEQEKVRRLLKESEVLYRSVVDDHLDFILRTDNKGKIVFINKSLASALNISSKGVNGYTIYHFIPEEEHNIIHGAITQLSITEPVIHYSHRMFDPVTESGFILSSWVLRALYNSKNTLTGYQAIGRDITKENENSLRLAESQRLESLAVMAGGMAHDFNNLLTPILGYADMVKTSLPQEDESVVYLDHVMKAALRGRDLANQVLTFSRQENVEDRSPIETGIIIKDILEFIRASTSVRIKLNINVDSETGIIRANPSDLFQILSNLCTNAVQAMLAGGTLDISVSIVKRDNKRYLQFIVSDTGEGISNEIISRIFEPFFTTKARRRGTGLGLSVVKGLIEDLNGQIECQSTPGEGTSFVTYIPCLDINLSPALEMNVANISLTGNEQVLIVDDDSTIANVLQRGLEKFGYKVTLRTSANEALAAFNNAPDEFDIIISDYTMPYMTGLELAWHIHRDRPSIPIILISGYSKLLSEEELERSGISGCIDKPFLIEEMVRTLRAALEA